MLRNNVFVLLLVGCGNASLTNPNDGSVTDVSFSSSDGSVDGDSQSDATGPDGSMNMDVGSETEPSWRYYGEFRARSVWGDWAVGDYGQIRRRVGSNWEVFPSGTAEHLYDVWGSGPNDVWAVGAHGIILKFDGTTWSVVRLGVSSVLLGIWGTSARDIWAVGTGMQLHWDGSTWSDATSSGRVFHDVWGDSPSNYWAVGDEGLAMRWDGSTWTPE